MNVLSVGIGGFLGAVSRYLLGKIPMHIVEGFPMNTFITNILGAIVIGVVFAATAKLGGSDSNMVLFLKTGFCGGLTTFSTFSLEGMQLLQDGHMGMFAAYALLSVGICVFACWAGTAIGNAI